MSKGQRSTKRGQGVVGTDTTNTSKPRHWKFGEDEDERLVSLIRMCGTTNWSVIVNNMNGRTERQCRERWYKYLSPDVKHGEWTAAEDSLLLEAYERHNRKWVKIAREIPGRTDGQVKDRWNKINRDGSLAEMSSSSDVGTDKLSTFLPGQREPSRVIGQKVETRTSVGLELFDWSDDDTGMMFNPADTDADRPDLVNGYE